MGPSGRRDRGQAGGPASQGASTLSAPGAAGYDGPSDGRGRSPSNAGQSQTGRPMSRTRSSSRGPATGQVTQPTDPARDPPARTPRVLTKNVDFGGEAYNILQNTGYVSFAFPLHCQLQHLNVLCAFISCSCVVNACYCRIFFTKQGSNVYGLQRKIQVLHFLIKILHSVVQGASMIVCPATAFYVF